MKVFLTKYCLTDGIKEIEVDECVRYAGMALLRDANHQTYFHKRDYSLSIDEARNKAEAMRNKKIKSLEAQIEKIRKISF